MTIETDVRTHRRRLFIDISKRKLRAGTGSSKAFLATKTTQMKWTDLKPVLAPLKFAVTDGVATRLYMPERFTKDLDVVVAVSDAQVAYEKLKRAGFQFQSELALVRGGIWISPDQQEIDVLEGIEPWWTDALNEAQGNLDAQGLPILPLRYLVLMKYQSGRAQDLADIERMLGQATDEALKPVRAIFARFAPDDLADLESLIKLGKLSA